jgi:G:T-mismatch repair DNA endonuclease (very short patch repair protein)
MAVSGTGVQTTSKPGTVSSYWDEKIRRTQERDREQKTALRQAGWEVLRFWDFEVKESVELLRGTHCCGFVTMRPSRFRIGTP